VGYKALINMERKQALMTVLADHIEDCLYEGITLAEILTEAKTIHAFYVSDKEDYCAN
jgi:hypothetical protein